MLGSKRRRLNAVAIGAALAIAFLAACGKSKTAADYIHDAEVHRKSGAISAAIIDLKDALQQDSKNATARLLLGRLYLDLPDGLAAEAELRRARQDGADSFAVSKALAEAELIVGKPDAALKEIDNLEAPDAAMRASILSIRGRALLALGRLLEAREAMEQGLKEDPHSVDVLSAMVWHALASGNLVAAKDRLEEAQKEDPNNATLFALRGAVTFALGDFAGSEEAYGKMRTLAPWNLSARLGSARAQLAQDKIKDAEANLDVVLKAAPNDPNANYLRALAAYREKDYLLAQSLIGRTLNGARDFAPAMLLAGATSYALKQFEQANTYLSQYLYRVPQSMQARKLLAAVQVALGHSADAVKTLSNAAQGSDDAELLGMIGVASAQSGDLAAADRYLNEAVKRQPGNAELRAQLGIAHIALGETEAGVAELQTAAQQDPAALRPEIALFITFLHDKDFDKALGVAERLRNSHPSEAIGFDFAGLVHSAQGEEQLALADFRKARELHPGDSIASRSLAALAARAGDFQTASRYYEDIVAANPRDIRAYFDLIALQMRDNRLADVHSTLDAAIRANPGHPALYALLGRVLLTEGKSREALNTIEPIFAKQPDDPSLLEVAGRAHLALGESEAAIGAFKSLVDALPKASASHRYLAEAYLSAKEVSRALDEATKAVAADSGDVSSGLVLSRVYMAKGSPADAQRVADDLAKRNPQDAAVADLQGSIQMAEGHTGEALDQFRRAVALADIASYRIHLAAALDRAGEAGGAQKTLTEWIADHPRDASARLALGDFYLKQKRNRDARAQYAAVLERYPDSAVAENNLAWVLSLDGQADEALKHAEHAAALAPSAAQVLDTYGIVLLQNGRPAEAVETLNKALEGAPASPDIRLHFAQALAGNGNKEKAREILLALLGSGQPFDGQDQARKLLAELGG